MGKHKKQTGIDVISFLADLGAILGYTILQEEEMFPGKLESPKLDITWRKDSNTKNPLFIFEVESDVTKSAVDNVIKVFSRKTPVFWKPLYFFHVFVHQSIGKDRIHYLQSNFENNNYGIYLLSDSEQQAQLIIDILDQHFRLGIELNLYDLTCFIRENEIIDISIVSILDRIVELKLDYFEQIDFIKEIETIIINKKYPEVICFYIEYLENYLSHDYPRPNYYYMSAVGYSFVTHYALFLMFNKNRNYDFVFEQLKKIEENFQSWPLWDPAFGLSQDHDWILLYEFPILLCLNCLVFSGTDFAKYFSTKLRIILQKVQYPNNLYGLIWLLISSQLACDIGSFNFAQLIINDHGGVAIKKLINPTLIIEEEYENILLEKEDTINIPDFTAWKEMDINIGSLTKEDIDILKSIIDGLLVMNNPIKGREDFALYCLLCSLI